MHTYRLILEIPMNIIIDGINGMEVKFIFLKIIWP